MNIEKIQSSLKTIKLGKNIHYLPEVDSTNLWAARTQPYCTGDVFLTSYQTGGYGRLKRTWESPSGKNILMTFIDVAPLDPSKIPQLTLVCGVAIARALREFNIPVTLKWPNDLFVQKRKLGGILCEADGSIVRIGVGLNINSTPADFSETLRQNVTSAFRELGKELPLEEVIAKCLTQYELTRHHYDITGVAHLLQEWETLTIPKGTTVRINDDGKTFEAKYNGVSPDGFLLVQVGDKIEKIISGDLILI